MRVVTLSIGDELLDGRGVDTHGAWFSSELVRHGCHHVEHRVVSDDVEVIRDAIVDLISRGELLLVTGGLGPTLDDLTRDALARVLKVDLEEDLQAREALRARLSGSGRPLGPGNLRQIMRPLGTRFLANDNGTAPGILAGFSGVSVVLLPGPPREMVPMFEAHVVPLLQGVPQERATIRSFGLSEAEAGERLGELALRDREPLVCFKVSSSVVQADVLGDGAREVGERINALWAPYAFGDERDSLPGVVGSMLTQRNSDVAVSESCTGGLLGGALTEISGSSDFFRGGLLTYSNELKSALLGVPTGLLQTVGAVSREVALLMALETARRLGTTYALSTTGIAGPGGGSSDKPVGTVWIGLCDTSGAQPVVFARCFLFSGDRTQIRDRTVKAALQMLRHRMLGVETSLLWEVES